MNFKTLARKVILFNHFNGVPKITDFKVVEEELRASLYHEEILCKASWHSLDPYMRGLTSSIRIGDTMPGSQVARVVKSNNRLYPEGSKVVGNFGWRDYTIYKPTTVPMYDTLFKMPDMRGLPESLALGAVGVAGNTAYFGLTKLCDVQIGEVLVVSYADGAVGSLVGQIGKLKGCKVIGFVINEAKLNWVRGDLKFDHAFNLKDTNVDDILRELAPQGVNSCFDNVGGSFTCDVLKNMNRFGRIALCRTMPAPSMEFKGIQNVPMDYFSLINKEIRMEGFTVARWSNQWYDGLFQMREWISEGKIKVQENVKTGLTNMPEAFVEMIENNTAGKTVVKA